MACCIFCRLIADPEFKALYRDDDVVAFADLNPQAPVHFLVVPRNHVETIAELDDEYLLGRILAAAHTGARDPGISEGGERLVCNQGPHAGPTSHHVHLHARAGRQRA